MPRKNPVSEKIKKDLANELNEFGYEYISGTSDPWILERNIEDFNIKIFIQKYRFDKNVLIIQIKSDGLTFNGERCLRGIIDKHGNYKCGGAWKYDEESLDIIISEMADIIKNECEPIINNLSYRKPFQLDNEMYINLYNNHVEYRRLFLEENGELLKIDSNRVSGLVDTIQNICEKIKDRPVAEQKEMILRIASYLGDIIIENTRKQWVLEIFGERKYAVIADIDNVVDPQVYVNSIDILHTLTHCYMNNNFVGIKEELESNCASR